MKTKYENLIIKTTENGTVNVRNWRTGNQITYECIFKDFANITRITLLQSFYDFISKATLCDKGYSDFCSNSGYDCESPEAAELWGDVLETAYKAKVIGITMPEMVAVLKGLRDEIEIPSKGNRKMSE